MTKSSKIFVAGGTGLVGTAIIKNLLEKGCKNIVANYHSRPPATNHESRITNHEPRYEKLDLTDQRAVADFFAAEKPEYVFLAAAKVGGIVANNTYRAEFIYENLQIQNNIIHQSYLHGVKKLLFLGSTCIYPKECPQPMREEYLLTSPLEYTNEPYAVAKIAGIKMCEGYNLQYGTNFISVMPTNLYGPNDNFDLEKSHVLPALIRKMHLGRCLETGDRNALRADLNKLPVEGIDGNASKDEILAVLQKYGLRITNHESRPTVQVEIWGSGRPMREFLWSEDMADACVYLMENHDFEDVIRNALSVKCNDEKTTNKSRDEKSCETVTDYESRVTSHEIRNTHINIGTGREVSIRELAETIKAIVGFGGELHFNKERPDGTLRKLTDVSKLHALGWRHTVELSEGVTSLYRWYRSTL